MQRATKEIISKHERLQKSFQGGQSRLFACLSFQVVVEPFAYPFRLLSMQCKLTFMKHFILSTPQKMPHVLATVAKMHFVSSNASFHTV